MHGYRKRIKEQITLDYLDAFPCVAILGARQVGKSTLAKVIIKKFSHSIYLDLEDPRDLIKLQDPLAYLEANKDVLICIDEVQLFPNLFKFLRSYLDKNNRSGQLLLLGSASRDLIKQSSETLAGRIAYVEIGPFNVSETNDLNKLWLQGGYPSSYFLKNEMSFEWRINYIRTFLERDIPQLGFNIPAETLKRFWTMLAHINSELLNQSKLAASMGVSVPTIKRYLDILEGTFIIRRLKPYHTNIKKRLVKSPKIYIRDSGLIHCLLGIESYNDLLGHPAIGGTFETMVISSLLEQNPRYVASYYRSTNGAEVDLILEKGKKKIAIEIKLSSVPRLTPGFYESLKIIEPTQTIVIAQVTESFPIKDDIWVHNLKTVLDMDLL